MGATNCPETPRQRMITMMYLVYTAMLALNVSAEVVNGFKTVGNAMTRSNENLQVKLDDTYENFALALKNSPDKVQMQYDKAQRVKALSNEMEGYIDSIIYTFVGQLESKAKINYDPTNPKLVREIDFRNPDGTTNLDSVKAAMQLGGFSWINKIDNNHIGTPFFIGKAEGDNPTSGAAVDLKKKIIEYKQKVKEIVGEDSVHISLGLDVEREELNSEKKLTSWEMLNFNNTVAGAALVTLTRMKAETMNAEFDVVNMLYKQVSKGDFTFSDFKMMSRPKSAYVMRGGTYETAIMVGAYDKDQKFNVKIGGQTIYSDENGTANYRIVCNNVGPQTLRGVAYVSSPDGGTEEREFTDEFYVAEPSANISLDNMNVLYAGIENPITASAPGMNSRDIRVQMDAAAGKLVPSQGEGKYNVTPSANAKKIDISVYGIIDGQQKLLNTLHYRVKPIPNPVLKVGQYTNGDKKASRKDFTEGTLVLATKDPGFDFKIPNGSIRIRTMNITVGTKTCAPIENSNKLNAEVASAIRKANRGDNLVISATVQMPDGKPREVECVIKLAK